MKSIKGNFYLRIMLVCGLIYLILMARFWIVTSPSPATLQNSTLPMKSDEQYCLYEAGIRGSRIKVHFEPTTVDNLLQRYTHPSENDTILRFQLAENEMNYTQPPLHYALRTGHNFWEPTVCKSNYSIAIIIPFRDREEHLMIFLNHMHAFLRQQNVTYQIFVVEQVGEAKFNRGMLLNIGFKEANKLWEFDCYIFHDVDLLPEDTRNLYRCGPQPIHLTVSTAAFNYKLPYDDYFGGGIAVTRKQYEDINGYSNIYFGWGAEDDDSFQRFRQKNYSINRYSPEISRYASLKHGRDKHNPINPNRLALLSGAIQRMATDGINSLTYKLHRKQPAFGSLAYWIMVELAS